MRWDLAQEIDWRSVAANEEHLPGVEKDIQTQLASKALLAKYLGKGPEVTDEG